MTEMLTTGHTEIKKQFDLLHTCVIIPAYNNAGTLFTLIKTVSSYTHNIIVVNDGSTDDTGLILQSFSFIDVINFTVNKGKGKALRQAFLHAHKKGFQYAITIDADGQHFAKDLPAFIEKLSQYKNAIIVGARNMQQDTVPGGSSFGYKFSNFWFRLETGINCPDTQSGYRLYPLHALADMNFFTGKYEFEIEVLVRAAWKGINILSVPVTVYYPPKEARVSHFRPYKDFARISLLNVMLVLTSFLYIRPRNFLHSLFIKKNFRQTCYDHLFNPEHSDLVKSLSIGFGIFMGIIPIWGFQLVAAVFIAIVCKLNKPLVILAANISIPPMIPVIIYVSYKMGSIWMGDNAMQIHFNNALSLAAVQKNLAQYIYGSISLAIIAAAFFGLLSFILLKFFSKKSVLAS